MEDEAPEALVAAEVIQVVELATEIAIGVEEEPTQEEVAAPQAEETYVGEEAEEEGDSGPKEITPEMHEENLVVMREVLEICVELAAEGKLPDKKSKSEFELREKIDSSTDMLEHKEEDLEEREEEAELLSAEGEESLEGRSAMEDEEAETSSVQEAWKKRQKQLEEFDMVHDEAQRLRILNLLLQSRVLRAMQRRAKTRGVTGSAASAGSAAPAASATSVGSTRQEPMAPGDLAAIAESLEKELMEAGEVRRQLDAEMHRGPVEDDLRRRLATARAQVAERAEELNQLQEKLLQRMRTQPAKRQDAERMLKRVWPQLLRLRRERLRHARARAELESAQQQVSKLEAFGPDRTVPAFEELLADGVKLAEHAMERGEQLATLRNTAEQNMQQAAHFREELQGTKLANSEARRLEARASAFLKMAREEVLKMKRNRDKLYNKNNKLRRDMELLANPELLRDHEEVLHRLRTAQAELEKLRMMYVDQEKRIAAARRLLEHREQTLREGRHDGQRHSYQIWRMDAMCGPSRLDVKYGS